MDAAEIAGVVDPNWNNAAGATSRDAAGVSSMQTGTATGATVTWAANNIWMTPITDQAGNLRMMKGYLDTSSTSTTT